MCVKNVIITELSVATRKVQTQLKVEKNRNHNSAINETQLSDIHMHLQLIQNSDKMYFGIRLC